MPIGAFSMRMSFDRDFHGEIRSSANFIGSLFSGRCGNFDRVLRSPYRPRTVWVGPGRRSVAVPSPQRNMCRDTQTRVQPDERASRLVNAASRIRRPEPVGQRRRREKISPFVPQQRPRSLGHAAQRRQQSSVFQTRDSELWLIRVRPATLPPQHRHRTSGGNRDHAASPRNAQRPEGLTLGHASLALASVAHLR